uniref:Uncharacterized protein n=1 Tax=Meloidogyne enterolobii TaxID=390850 RepID=A0A6V7Y5N0_MELEN|nr:unnamed protein product [Meloidogyne enterolobii]
MLNKVLYTKLKYKNSLHLIESSFTFYRFLYYLLKLLLFFFVSRAMAKRSSSTCSAESGEYTVVADLNSKEELKGSISFAKGRGAATRWMKKFEQEKDGVYSVRLRCAFKRKTKCPLKLKGSSDGTAHLLSISAGQHLGHKLAELPGIEQVFHLPNAQIVSGVENGPKVVLENDNNEMMTVNRGDLGNVGTSDTACKKTPFAEGVTVF